MNGLCQASPLRHRKNDIVSLRQHSFLPHIIGEVFNKIAGTEGVQHIIGRHNIVVKYSRLFQPSVNFALAYVQHLRKLANAICHKFESLEVHISRFKQGVQP